MSYSYWRVKARSVIATVLKANDGGEEKSIRKALCVAYPFGEKKYHPYKIWLDEIKRQRGTGRYARHKFGQVGIRPQSGKVTETEDTRTLDMFNA